MGLELLQIAEHLNFKNFPGGHAPSPLVCITSSMAWPVFILVLRPCTCTALICLLKALYILSVAVHKGTGGSRPLDSCPVYSSFSPGSSLLSPVPVGASDQHTWSQWLVPLVHSCRPELRQTLAVHVVGNPAWLGPKHLLLQSAVVFICSSMCAIGVCDTRT